MDDTISRQGAINVADKYLDADGCNGSDVAQDIIADLMVLPSAEPQIIHCKDCEHYYFADNRVPSEQSWVCGYWGVDNNKHMGFCDRAERKKDGQI